MPRQAFLLVGLGLLAQTPIAAFPFNCTLRFPKISTGYYTTLACKLMVERAKICNVYSLAVPNVHLVIIPPTFPGDNDCSQLMSSQKKYINNATSDGTTWNKYTPTIDWQYKQACMSDDGITRVIVADRPLSGGMNKGYPLISRDSGATWQQATKFGGTPGE
jgi:hypothetical protein